MRPLPEIGTHVHYEVEYTDAGGTRRRSRQPGLRVAIEWAESLKPGTHPRIIETTTTEREIFRD